MANKLFHFYGLQALLSDLGIDAQVANTIATASQAVDDFTESKLISFENGELFYPVITAHRVLDPHNLDSRDASGIWMPFHFFPDGDGVCRPGTDNMRKLIDFVKNYSAQNDKEKYLLHGILLHIFADTYTHQGFMGLHCKHNDISSLDDEDRWDLGWIAGNFPPSIGHGEALTYPDDMWRNWSYKNHQGEKIESKNPDRFMQITKDIVDLLLELGYSLSPLSEDTLQKYRAIYSFSGREDDYENKMRQKFNKIAQDNWGQEIDISYKKWKTKVMRPLQSNENKYERTCNIEEFNKSEWVMFQKTAREIRRFFKREIFPNLRIHTRIY
jgi:hypothetical protein